VRRWHELVAAGAAGSVAMGTLGMRMIDGDFEPGFFINHFVKDLGLVLEECRRMRIVLPGVELADRFYRSMQGRGRGSRGTQDLINALAEFSGAHWPPAPEQAGA
ncbi:MAG: NAD(P)-dependent oxidoreductase, partial [Desulfovibrio sp.]|nr:NAD(P)-dependent oxidoreductase [Desulfovibrio sp.]